MLKKGRKILFSILVIGFCLIYFPVYAWQTGGYTGEGGTTGGGTSIDAMTDGGSGFNSGVYLFQLVYRPQGKNFYEIGKCVVVNTNQQGKYKIRDIDRKARSTAEANGCSYGSKNGSLLSIANEIHNNGGVDNIPVISEKEYATKLVAEFGLKFDNLNLRGSTPGNYNSYGYRILVQKLTCFGYSSSDLTTWCAVLWPRKAWAKQNPNLGLFGGSYQGDLYTTQDDIGIRNASERRSGWYPTTGNGSDLGRAFADVNRGEGYNIIGFDDNMFGGYDYTIDAACVGCDVSNSDNLAYYIQDTNDWDAIFASPGNTDNKNVRTYYDKGNDVFCREEYKVYFPNMNNQIDVGTGRYFTVNVSADELLGVGHSTFPNFKPVKVIKVRECRVNPNSGKSAEQISNALYAFEAKSKSDFSTKLGKVSFRYNETYKDSRYNMNDAEEMEPYDEGTYTVDVSGNMLLMTASREYTLPPNYYRYIGKDGLPVKGVPSNINQYIDLGFSSLPVSYENKGENGKAGDIQFAFELPTNDRYSKLNKAYQSDNKYLATNNPDGNLYQKFLTSELDENDKKLLEQSACAIMFGYDPSVGSPFYNCAEDRDTNSIGESGHNCVDRNKLSLTGNKTQGYSCIILSDGADNQCYIDQKTGTYYGVNGTAVSKEQYYIDCPCKDEADASDLGVDWNPVKKMCCPEGATYNEETGECDGGTGGSCKTEEDAKRLGREWNVMHKYCCPVGTKYNSNTGKCDQTNSTKCHIKDGKYYDHDGKQITKEEYNIICPEPDITYECPPEKCKNGCCPDGSCAPMPDGTCPGPGGIDVIYRTIDLEDPFPGQNAENRETGSNWCSYNIKFQKFSCAYNNTAVKEYITRENNGIKNGSKVYNEDHVLYEVTLDAKTINKVRSYNDDHKYDDWTLKCLDNGKACQSEFLEEEVDVSGKCASTTKDSFYTCDDDLL